jgi:hypothetical protein
VTIVNTFTICMIPVASVSQGKIVLKRQSVGFNTFNVVKDCNKKQILSFGISVSVIRLGINKIIYFLGR